MIVRTLAEATGNARDVRGRTWRSRRLLLADDRMGFSLHETTIRAGTTTVMQYLNHLEAVYCIGGRGSVRTLPDGEAVPVVPGTVYALDAHDHHELRAEEELRLVCVFSPPLTGDETHDEHGSYPARSSAGAEGDPYPTRGREAAVLPRRTPVLHGGLDARGPLGRDELRAFSLRGYVVRRGVFDANEVALLLRESEQAATRLGPSDPRVVREPDSDRMRSLFAFHELGGPLAQLATDARLVGPACQVLGSDVAIHQSRVNHKPGFDGREFGWHSDFETWHAEDGMPDMRALSAVVFLSRNDATNGAMLVVPGSHRSFVACAGQTPPNHYETSLRRQEYGVPDRAILRELVEDLGVDAVHGDPGDVLFFDCNLLHGSPGNISPVSRTNAFVVFDSVQNRPRRWPSGLAPRPLHVSSDGTNPAVVPQIGRIAPSD